MFRDLSKRWCISNYAPKRIKNVEIYGKCPKVSPMGKSQTLPDPSSFPDSFRRNFEVIYSIYAHTATNNCDITGMSLNCELIN